MYVWSGFKLKHDDSFIDFSFRQNYHNTLRAGDARKNPRRSLVWGVAGKLKKLGPYGNIDVATCVVQQGSVYCTRTVYYTVYSGMSYKRCLRHNVGLVVQHRRLPHCCYTYEITHVFATRSSLSLARALHFAPLATQLTSLVCSDQPAIERWS